MEIILVLSENINYYYSNFVFFEGDNVNAYL